MNSKVICSQSAPALKERHFYMDPMHGKISIANANMLFRFDMGRDDLKGLPYASNDILIWSSVTAFITKANLVLLVFSLEGQQFYSMGGGEFLADVKDRHFDRYNDDVGHAQEIYGYDLDVFVDLFVKADN